MKLSTSLVHTSLEMVECEICGAKPTRVKDWEVGRVCDHCLHPMIYADYYLNRTPGICRPTVKDF